MTSVAAGGPSTGHGIDYQIAYAVWRFLEFISRALAVPHKAWTLRLEPRAVRGGGATCWDLGLDPGDTLVEVKLNPTRSDVLDWLDRVAAEGSSYSGRTFRLVYSKGGGALLPAVSRLLHVATEAAGEPEAFQRLVDVEEVRDAPEILSRLGSHAHNTLQRMKLEPLPEPILRQNIDVVARWLAGETAGGRLTDLLFRKFHEGVAERKTFLVRDTIAQVRREGMDLQSPPAIDPTDLSPSAASALFVLQRCPTSVPLEVLAETSTCPEAELAANLALLEKETIVASEAGCWWAYPLPSQLTRPDGPDLLARALESLLNFIVRHKDDGAGVAQIRNAIALIRECAGPRPQGVATAFMRLDKLLKRLGDKHLVYEVAELSITAARRAPRTREAVEGEAHALICGRSWVLQRIGRLAEARAAAERSLKLGEDIGWERNSAFCKKCIGRLCRTEAEETDDRSRKGALLAESAAYLKDAADRFGAMHEFGPNDPEVGDCHSLLGRTHLVAQQFGPAGEAVRHAFHLIKNTAGKDYLDLEILAGDLEAALGHRQTAADYYDGALARHHADDPELTEMRARAHLQRGRNRAELGQAAAAIQDLRRAAEIWRALSEAAPAGQAEWEEIRIRGVLSETSLRVLEREARAQVRVAAYRGHESRLASLSSGRRARRTEPDRVYWEQLLKDARGQVAVEVPEW